MTPAELPPIHYETCPWWIPPALAFVAGCAATATVLMPVVAGPDFARGHSMGYKIGLEDGQRMKPAGEYDRGWQEGFKHGKASRD